MDKKSGTKYDVIIVGGSYAGLSAAMALGRSLRDVLVIDAGEPCNRQTPHSHNFLTQDGESPATISAKAKEEVMAYKTVRFHKSEVINAGKGINGFDVGSSNGEVFTCRKLLFATGLKDQLSLKGMAECWGISVLHCPYCHGYEVRNEEIGIIANGDSGFEFARLLSNWTNRLKLFTNGSPTLSDSQTEKLLSRGIEIVDKEIAELKHVNGNMDHIVFTDQSSIPVRTLFTRAPFSQHCDIPALLGCELTEMGHIKVDEMQKTNVAGVYAAGDNSSMMRAVSGAIAAGTKAGAMINHELIQEDF